MNFSTQSSARKKGSQDTKKTNSESKLNGRQATDVSKYWKKCWAFVYLKTK